MIDVWESGETLGINSPMSGGQRVLFILLSLFPLLAPYELIVRVDWQDYFNLPFLFVLLISVGAIVLSALLLWAGIAGLSSSIQIDRRRGVISYSASAPVVPMQTTRFPINSIDRMQVAVTEWSDSAPSFSMEFVMAGGRSIRSGSSWSRAEVEAVQERVATFLSRAG